MEMNNIKPKDRSERVLFYSINNNYFSFIHRLQIETEITLKKHIYKTVLACSINQQKRQE